tara:strand:- start:5055 stop:5498 length:444 start_codon:yes stop_codon:yes gene_type:complete
LKGIGQKPYWVGMNMSDEEEPLSVESRIAPPPLTCPRCDNLLPSELGEVKCRICRSEVKVEHEGTRKAWREEKISCPACNKVLIAGVDKRPAKIECSSCKAHFELKAHKVKVEITCPKCECKLRMNQRPGERQITCPACSAVFKINF